MDFGALERGWGHFFSWTPPLGAMYPGSLGDLWGSGALRGSLEIGDLISGNLYRDHGVVNISYI